MSLHPLVELFQIVDPGDLADLLPWSVAVKAVRLFLGKEEPKPLDPSERDPVFMARFLRSVRWIGQTWFDFKALDTDRIPRTGPALLVGNHNGGLLTFDALFTLLAVSDACGLDREVFGLGHDFVERDPTIRKYAGKAGVLRAGHDSAARAFARGGLVLVYPGSDYDSFRPFSERNRVVLANRTGFIRLALREQVPIVPVVTVGAQEAFVVLTRGERLAKWMGLPGRLRTNVFPLALSVPWGLTSAYLFYFPLPTPIRTAFCDPIRWPELGPNAAEDPATVQRCYRQVEAVMQRRMDELSAGRLPWLG